MSDDSKDSRRQGTDEIPLAGYAIMATIFSTGMAAMLAFLGRERRLPRAWPARDLILTGIATSRLARLLTRSRVAMPFRAPFAEYQGSAGAGEVNERPRGHGIRRAIGSLVTCPFCAAPWIATASMAALVVRPRVTRFVRGVLVSVAVADWAQQIYAASRRLS